MQMIMWAFWKISANFKTLKSHGIEVNASIMARPIHFNAYKKPALMEYLEEILKASSAQMGHKKVAVRGLSNYRYKSV